MKNELERIRDNLKCSLNMGGLRDAAQWTIEELDRLTVSLPVGVPDASELQRVIYSADAAAKRMLDADSFWWSEIATIRVEFERFMRALLAAPTVKAEQVQRLRLVEMIDAAMVEMQNISPPLRRSECERLIRAALSAQQSAPERVSVPVELLQDLHDLASDAVEHHRAAFAGYKLKRQANMDDVVGKARALLASHGRGEA